MRKPKTAIKIAFVADVMSTVQGLMFGQLCGIVLLAWIVTKLFKDVQGNGVSWTVSGMKFHVTDQCFRSNDFSCRIFWLNLLWGMWAVLFVPYTFCDAIKIAVLCPAMSKNISFRIPQKYSQIFIKHGLWTLWILVDPVHWSGKLTWLHKYDNLCSKNRTFAVSECNSLRAVAGGVVGYVHLSIISAWCKNVGQWLQDHLCQTCSIVGRSDRLHYDFFHWICAQGMYCKGKI